MSFSERYGFKPVKDIVQITSMDDELRIGLWNVLTVVYWNPLSDNNPTGNEYVRDKTLWPLLASLWVDYWKFPLDTLSYWWADGYRFLRKDFFGCEWHEAYSLIEFVGGYRGLGAKQSNFMDACNNVLKRELSGYRFVGHLLVPITAEEQLAAVEAALNSTGPNDPVRVHLETALKHLSDRNDPDYRNSIKESISAVESLCKLIAKAPKATLGDALDAVERRVKLHPALRKSIISLYGYTSDADGIRHALLEESSLGQEDALFMLVSCSGFINFLTQKAAKASINLNSSVAQMS